MKTELKDMTTPLNVEMLRELRESLKEINKQRSDSCMVMSEESMVHERIVDASAQSVMKAITWMCSPAPPTSKQS